jgi:hypothetical protein
MNQELILVSDLNCSMRLQNVLNWLEIKNISELREYYIGIRNKQIPTPRNLSMKSISEIEDILKECENIDGVEVKECRETLRERDMRVKMENKMNGIKTLIKQLHKEAFYGSEVDVLKISELGNKLNKMLN